MRKLVGTSGWSPAGWKPIWSDWIRSKHGHRHYGNECLGVANGPKYDYPVKTSLAPLRLPAFGVWIKRRNKAKGPAGQRTKSKKLTNTPWEGVDLESLSLMKPFTRIRLWVRSMNYSPGFYLFILQKEEPFIRKSRAKGKTARWASSEYYPYEGISLPTGANSAPITGTYKSPSLWRMGTKARVGWFCRWGGHWQSAYQYHGNSPCEQREATFGTWWPRQ